MRRLIRMQRNCIDKSSHCVVCQPGTSFQVDAQSCVASTCAPKDQTCASGPSANDMAALLTDGRCVFVSQRDMLQRRLCRWARLRQGPGSHVCDSDMKDKRRYMARWQGLVGNETPVHAKAMEKYYLGNQ